MKVLLPIDNSQGTQKTLAWATRFLDKTRDELVLLHVVFWSVDALVREEEIQQAESLLKETKTFLENHGFYVVDAQYLFGSPSQMIGVFAEEYGIDQIIIGSHGETALREILMGNVSHRVFKTATVPVLLLNNQAQSYLEASHLDQLALKQQQNRLMRILLPVDGSPGTQRTLTWAAQFLNKANSRLYVLYAVYFSSELPAIAFSPEDGQQIVNDAKAYLEGQGFQVEKAEYVFDTPQRAILQYADEHQMDEIVIGSHGYRGITRLLLGSISESIFKHARQPVVLINNAPDRSLKISHIEKVNVSLNQS